MMQVFRDPGNNLEFSNVGKAAPLLGSVTVPTVGSFLTLCSGQCQWLLSPVSGPPIWYLEIPFMHLKGIISTKWLLEQSCCSERFSEANAEETCGGLKSLAATTEGLTVGKCAINLDKGKCDQFIKPSW